MDLIEQLRICTDIWSEQGLLLRNMGKYIMLKLEAAQIQVFIYPFARIFDFASQDPSLVICWYSTQLTGYGQTFLQPVGPGQLHENVMDLHQKENGFTYLVGVARKVCWL